MLPYKTIIIYRTIIQGRSVLSNPFGEHKLYKSSESLPELIYESDDLLFGVVAAGDTL